MEAENKEPSFLKSFIAGGMGGVAFVYVGHPLDTIKVIEHHVLMIYLLLIVQVRLQTMPQALPGQPALYSGTFDCIHKTFNKEGIRGMYRGLLSPLAGVTPIYALYFLGYSIGKRLQLRDAEEENDLR